VEVTNVLIPWYPISYLTIASSGFLGGALTGPYPMLRFGGACGLGVGAFYQVTGEAKASPTLDKLEIYGDGPGRPLDSSHVDLFLILLRC
jgi:hypothetical protein